MKKNKGFPYKERKKSKTATKIDKRPHTNQPPTYRTVEVKEERKFENCLDIRFNKGQDWNRHEIHMLIDMWAEISWGKNSTHHSKASKLSGYVHKLWKKQNGKCAVSGIPLYGAPSCGVHDFGICKGIFVLFPHLLLLLDIGILFGEINK